MEPAQAAINIEIFQIPMRLPRWLKCLTFIL